jgi:DHA1 family bicyclomycin/chloramphenicol resistance-like MFS transporter
MMDDPAPTPDIIPGDATEGASIVGDSAPARAEVAQHGWRVLATLSALMAFGPISTDLYLPALPAMGRALGADAGTMELTVSGYLIGFSLGQLLWGPMGDRYGRRAPIAVGIVLFLVGSVGCALATGPWEMIGWRVLQAAGACAGVVLARAMVRDLYAGSRAAQMLSTLLTVMAIAPLIAPLLGGQILAFAGWRAIFWTMVGTGLLTLVALFKLPETLPRERRNTAPLLGALASYGRLLRNRRLLAYAGAGGFFYVGIFAYIAGTPFAYITYHHLAPQLYGLLFAASIVGIMAANLVNARFVARIGGDRLLTYAASVSALAGLGSALAGWTGWGGLFGLAVPLILFCSASGFIVANSISGALADFPERAGTVSALVGSIHYGSGIVGSALVGAFADGTPWPLGCVVAFAGLGSVACARLTQTRAGTPSASKR